jgi:CubicO group peptidase (beta-lactamase class C family)
MMSRPPPAAARSRLPAILSAARSILSGVFDVTEARLAARTARAQAEGRLPSLVAAVARDDGLAWWAGRGRLDPTAGSGGSGGSGGTAPDSDTQYRIGSITKTFTAVLVMQLRDEGLLTLADPLEQHVPGTPFGDRTVGQLLSHGAGLLAETGGPWWERTPGGAWPELVAGAAAVRHPPGRRFHYSNFGYGALGELIARLRGRPWADCLAATVLAPLGMRRTTLRPAPPAAPGFAVHPWADLLLPEPEHDAGAMAAAGQLWSTAADMARFAAFLLGDTADVLAPATLEEMTEPALVDYSRLPWTAYGLGLQVFDADDDQRIVGHSGSMPGFLAALVVAPHDRVAVVALANSTAGLDFTLCGDLIEIVRTCEPAIVPEWSPAREVDPELLGLLGTWHWGPAPFILRLRGDGLLQLAPIGEGTRKSRFRGREAGVWVGLDGYFAGEELRPVRRDGAVVALDLATFVFTRTPYDPQAPVPGGVDDAGWQTGA